MVPRSLVLLLPLLGALSALAFAGPVSAQSKPDAPPGAPTGIGDAAVRGAHGAAFVDGGLWAAGPGYKAYFSERGIELHPALGAAAPRSFPLAFELEAVLRGGVVVLAPGAVQPELGLDGVVRYARAPGVVERYETRAQGIEQSFVFDEPLAGTGDLVVRGRITTELAAEPGEHETLDFLLPGLGGVRFGRVTGVDAAGRTAPGRLRHAGTALELVLPADFVDGAAYPLVLDPLIGGQFLVAGDGVHSASEPDVAYDFQNHLYLVAWQVQYSESDFDVHALRVSTTGGSVGGLIPLETDSHITALFPTVANVRASRRFLVAWQEKATAAPFGSYDIMARAVRALDGGISSRVTIAEQPEGEWYPDAAGERTTADDDALVVWYRQPHGIFGAEVHVPTAGDPSVVHDFVVAADGKATRPAISKSMGDSGRAMVVYEYLYTLDDVDVHGVILDRDGGLLAGPLGIAQTGDDEFQPDVDGDGDRWIVAYARSFPGKDTEIVGTITWYPSGISAETLLTVDEVDQHAPAVAWTPGKVFVAWEQVFGQFDHDVYVKGVDPADCLTCETTQVLDYSGTLDRVPELASQYSGGGSGDQVFATWHSGTEYVSGFLAGAHVKGHLLEAFGGGAVTDLGGGCGTGGTLTTIGAVAAGNPSLELRLTGADPTAPLALLVLRPAGAPLSCGSCKVILPGLSAAVPVTAGTASKVLAVPCVLAAVGAEIDAQWAVLGTGASPCPFLGHVSASNRLRLTIGP